MLTDHPDQPGPDGHRAASELPFGGLLRRHRRTAGLTQDELAERAGVSARSISDFERGTPHAPRRETVDLLVEALTLSPADRATFVAPARRLRFADHPPSDPERVLARVPPPSPSARASNGEGSAAGSAFRDLPDSPAATFPSDALAAPPTPLLGRDALLGELVALARRPEVRLLTLTGAPGVGKTRLALAVAHALAPRWPEGARVVPLAAVREPRLVVSAIARALGLRSESVRPPLAILIEHLRAHPLLLVLDNFEQVLDAAPDVAELLAACPKLVVLATSRAPLRLRGEWEREVAPLALPTPEQARDPATVLRSPAVELFVARARAIQPDFTLDATNAGTVAALCARLDGLPLAIELAAPLLRLLPLPALLDQLDHRLPLLVGGARDLPARQRTLRAAIDWSYDRLAPSEQARFRRLGVFPAGADLTAIRAVTASDDGADLTNDLLAALTVLAEHSLLRHDPPRPGEETRYTTLETIREYAAERLAGHGELAVTRSRHAAHFLARAEAAERHLRGPDQTTWLERLERERDNLRAALSWYLERQDAESAQRLAGALGWFWWTRGYLDEGQRWLDQALQLGRASDATVSRALKAAATIAREQRHLNRATAWLEAALQLCHPLENPRETIGVLFGLGGVALTGGDAAAAERYYRQALDQAHAASLELEIAGALHNVAVALADQGKLDEAAALAADAHGRFAELGDRLGVARAGLTRGDVDYRRGDLAAARARLETALEQAREVGSPLSIALVWRKLAEVADAQGDDHRALACCRASLALGLRSGMVSVVAEALEIAARVSRRRGDPAGAARLVGAALAWREKHPTLRDPPFQAVYDRDGAALRDELGPARFDAECAAGRALAPEAALGLATESPSEVIEPSSPSPSAPPRDGS